jgi:hypothetical protein
LESWIVFDLIALWGSESSDLTRRIEDCIEEMADRRVERESSASLMDESWWKRWGWRERTSERSWDSRRRIAWWRCSAVEAGEPEERAAEEKEVEEKEGERNGERNGSLEKESRGEAEEVAVVEDGGGEEAEGVLKVERRWRGEEEEGEGEAFVLIEGS